MKLLKIIIIIAILLNIMFFFSIAEEIKPEMLFIHGGIFKMGSEQHNWNEKPVHIVKLSDFYMGRYEVTNREYCLFLNSEGKIHTDEIYHIDISSNKFCGITESPTGIFKVKSGYNNRPVVCVTWYGAVDYCKWLGKKTGEKYRLPSEAEWEYACRAGTATDYYWGNIMDGNYCWYEKNSNGNHHDVGEKNPNAWGLYDMSGNVSEWCYDEYYKYQSGYVVNPIFNPKTFSLFRVYRGGGWDSNENFCQSSNRINYSPEYSIITLGFRIAKTP